MDKILVCEYSKKTLCLSVVNFIMLYKEVPTFYVCEYHFFVCMVIKRKLSWQDFSVVLLRFLSVNLLN